MAQGSHRVSLLQNFLNFIIIITSTRKYYNGRKIIFNVIILTIWPTYGFILKCQRYSTTRLKGHGSELSLGAHQSRSRRQQMASGVAGAASRGRSIRCSRCSSCSSYMNVQRAHKVQWVLQVQQLQQVYQILASVAGAAGVASAADEAAVQEQQVLK